MDATVVMQTMEIAADNGVPFLVRIVRKGDRYGRSFAITHGEDAPLVEFYDRRYDDPSDMGHGQFVSRYYAETVLGIPWERGLDLDGGVPSWKIDAESMRYVKAWIRVALDY